MPGGSRSPAAPDVARDGSIDARVDLTDAVDVRTNRLTERIREERTVSRSRCRARRAVSNPRLLADARDRSLDYDPVEAREYADDLVRVTVDQARQRGGYRRPRLPTYFLGFGYAEVGNSPSASLLIESRGHVEFALFDLPARTHRRWCVSANCLVFSPRSSVP